MERSPWNLFPLLLLIEKIILGFSQVNFEVTNGEGWNLPMIYSISEGDSVFSLTSLVFRLSGSPWILFQRLLFTQSGEIYLLYDCWQACFEGLIDFSDEKFRTLNAWGLFLFNLIHTRYLNFLWLLGSGSLVPHVKCVFVSCSVRGRFACYPYFPENSFWFCIGKLFMT